MSQRIPFLYIAPSNLHGNGVFCAEDIPAGSIIEVCPVLLIPPDQMPLIKNTVLYDYYFTWQEDEQAGAIALGNGSIYNHSYDPNARYYVDFENNSIEIHSILAIPAGDEILISYNGDPANKTTVWFEKKKEEK